jgi:uncharacterized membrane protein (DUF106 family)
MKMSNQPLNINANQQISIPYSEKRIDIRTIDWSRIKKYISQSEEKYIDFSIIYSILYGIAGSTGVTLMPLFSSNGLKSWLIPLYICVSVFSLVCAIIFTIVNSAIRRNKKEAKNNIRDEMEEIEKEFNDE